MRPPIKSADDKNKKKEEKKLSYIRATKQLSVMPLNTIFAYLSFVCMWMERWEEDNGKKSKYMYFSQFSCRDIT